MKKGLGNLTLTTNIEDQKEQEKQQTTCRTRWEMAKGKTLLRAGMCREAL